MFEDGNVVDDQGDAAGLLYLGQLSDLVGRDSAPFAWRLALDTQELALVTAHQIRYPVFAHAVGDRAKPPDTTVVKPGFDLGLDSTFRGGGHLSY